MTRSLLRYFLPTVLLLLFSLPGCVRQQHAQSAELTTFHNGALKMPDNPDAPKLVYVDVHDSARCAPNLSANLGKALASGKFRLADSPSKAGYILHVTILRQGNVAPEVLKNVVNAGYGSSAKFSGQGARAILADALLTQRRVPTHKRPSRQKIKNISSRNALDSAQMRLAVLETGKKAKNEGEVFSAAIAQELALRMAK